MSVPVPDKNRPNHIQRVFDMTSEEMEAEVEAIYNLKAIDPDRNIPESFRDDE